MADFVRPNLFALAPSELAQDAAIGWLLSWADHRAEAVDAALHRAGRELLVAMFEQAGVTSPGSSTVKVRRQWPGEGRGTTGAIDLVVEVGDTHVLAVEDKTGTGEHSGQLKRYADALVAKYPSRTRALIYLKTGDQSSYKAVKDGGWHPFLRSHLLRVLGAHVDVRSDIFCEFFARLEKLEGDVQAWRSTPLTTKWERPAWRGFFMALQNELGEGNWDYVANAAGGFMGFWWSWTGVDGGQVYAQLEEDVLVAKVEASTNRSTFRDHWSKAIIAGTASSATPFKRPSRMGNGEYMTVARLAVPYRLADANGRIDFEATVALVRRAVDAVRSVARAEVYSAAK